MIAMLRRRGKRSRVLAGGLLALLLMPAAASAFFPPFYNYPYPDPVLATPGVVIPNVTPVGVPEVPPVVTPVGQPEEPEEPTTTPVFQTPEPTTIVSGLLGLACLAAWRRSRGKLQTAAA